MPIKRTTPSSYKAMDMTACAITDHGSMSGVVEFYDEAVKGGIVPIIGCEFYIDSTIVFI